MLFNHTCLHDLLCDIWGNAYKTQIQYALNMHKPSNTLFIKRNTPKLKDSVDLGAAQIMYKAANKYLPHNMQDV